MRLQLQFAIDLRTTRRFQLRLNQLRHSTDYLVNLYGMNLRRRHPGEFAEASDNCFQVGDLGQQSSRTFAEYFVELFRSLLPRPNQIFDRELQRKQRILQFMGQPPRQFAPGCDSFGLNQPFALSLIHI